MPTWSTPKSKAQSAKPDDSLFKDLGLGTRIRFAITFA